MEDYSRLLEAAIKSRHNSYAPYSHFRVGAALLTKSGEIITGCNIENASYPAGICAERTALVKAVSEGKREFEAIAVAGSLEQFDEAGVLKDELTAPAFPCGICRQMLREFVDPESFLVLTAAEGGKVLKYTLAQLLPESFGPENLA